MILWLCFPQSPSFTKNLFSWTQWEEFRQRTTGLWLLGWTFFSSLVATTTSGLLLTEGFELCQDGMFTGLAATEFHLMGFSFNLPFYSWFSLHPLTVSMDLSVHLPSILWTLLALAHHDASSWKMGFLIWVKWYDRHLLWFRFTFPWYWTFVFHVPAVSFLLRDAYLDLF